MRTRLLATVAALGVLASGCGAPTTAIGMREYAADIAYADESRPPPPPPPPAAEPAPAFPGFVAPPAPRAQPVAVGEPEPSPVPTTTTTTTIQPVACPEDDPLAVPTEEAGPSIPGSPLPGGYPFRQEGAIEVDGDVTETLPAETVHRVDDIVAMPGDSVRYNVAVDGIDATTVTTYEVSRRGVENGLHIVQIRTEDDVATDAFTPSAPIKVLPTPPVTGDRWSSSGADPLHRVGLTINGRILGKTRVNACGTPVEAWLVEVGDNPDTGQPSQITGPGKQLTITGTYAVATQMGGLIVAEDLTLSGTDGGRQVEITRTAAINRTTPDS